MISFKKTIALIIIVAGLMLISGCVVIIPLQHVPNLQGVVLKDGEPVAGADVRYIVMECGDDQDQGRVKAKGKTLADGSFTIEGKRRLDFVFVAADYAICWRLCFQEEGSAAACWYVETFGPPQPPEFIELECDLNAHNVCRVLRCSDEYFWKRYKNAPDIGVENDDQ